MSEGLGLRGGALSHAVTVCEHVLLLRRFRPPHSGCELLALIPGPRSEGLGVSLASAFNSTTR
jgi:hypothetical protein